ncbi:uncharacterized protein EAF01_005074 [Botrytis porri]|nr:uncharacterized protein EAF01_005074 [Botrytis porri]KAF7907488.1 hypothetical protein EAF01_005074 [Botrytis porri]
MHPLNSYSSPSQSHRHQQEVYIPQQESIKIRQPVPSYSRWRNHRILNRTYSAGSVQQIPNRDETQSQSQLETKQEVKHVMDEKVKVKRGSAADNHSASNSESSKNRKHLKAVPKRKTKDRSPRENSFLTKTSNFQKVSAKRNSTVSAEPKTRLNLKAANQDQDRKRDQIPHPLQSHPYSPIPNIEISESHTKEKSLPSPPIEHPAIPELEGSEQKFL